jgi:hypothetical protein
MALTPEQRSLRARMGSYALQAKYDMREHTKPAREAFMARFEREVDPDGVLSPAERMRRAEAAKTLHFQKLAWKSAKARRKEPVVRNRPRIVEAHESKGTR